MSDADQLQGSDLVLLMLAAPTDVSSAKGRINGITRLEKLLYLVERETSVADQVVDDSLTFIAYDYGPFSKGVYEAVEILEQSGLLVDRRTYDGRTIDSIEDVEVTGAVDDDEYVERRFELTPSGRLVAELLGQHHPDVVEELTRIKDAYAERPLSALIRYVYRTYPESTVNSKIAHRV